MKDLLIIFIVLLVLLLMISSFGGSLRYTDYIKPIENQIVGQEMTCRGRDENFTQDEDSNLLFNNNINNVNNGNIGNVVKTVINGDQFKKQIPLPQKEIHEPKLDISPYDNSSEVYETLYHSYSSS
jgi:hypothetical protein